MAAARTSPATVAMIILIIMMFSTRLCDQEAKKTAQRHP